MARLLGSLAIGLLDFRSRSNQSHFRKSGLTLTIPNGPIWNRLGSYPIGDTSNSQGA